MNPYEQLTLLLLDSLDRANHSATQERERAMKMTAISGQKLSGLYEKQSPLGLLVKMFLESQVWNNPTVKLLWKPKQMYARNRKWSLKQSGKTSKKQGINPSQLLFQLAVSGHRTKDTESSLWATPIVSQSQRSEKFKEGRTPNLPEMVKLWSTPRAKESGDYQYSQGNHEKPTLTLTGQVKLWKTPSASDGEGGVMEIRPETTGKYKLRDQVAPINQKLWPTPQARDFKGSSGRSLKNQETDLPTAVKMWPAPAAQDGKNSTLPQSQQDRDTIPGAVMRHGQSGQLNPEWVEIMMGFPIGYTDPEDSKTAAEFLKPLKKSLQPFLDKLNGRQDMEQNSTITNRQG